MILIICSADPLKKSPEIQVSSTSCGSLLDAKIGLTRGKDLALGELGEETIERVSAPPATPEELGGS